MKNELSRAMASADVKVRYDTQCKRVLSQKEILARILARTVKEFAGMSVEEIIPCIEGTPEIAVVSIDPGKTNQKRVLHMEEEKRIAGLANEDKVADEGEIYYDIRFYVHIPNEEGHIRMIVNLEAQKSYYPGYEIVTRGIFYDARMISAQLGTEFEHSKYDDMKKVFCKLSQSSGVSPNMRRAQEYFMLMFSLRGMPFVDLAYLRKSDLRDNVITYRRRKTGRPLSVTLTPEAMILVKKYMNRDSSSPYLFPFLESREGTKEAYREYQLALRSFNQQLMLLGELLGLGDKLSSYTAKHNQFSI